MQPFSVVEPDAPLRGVRVLSVTVGAAGPMVANALGYFGAEVIHLESRVRPDGHRGGHNPASWNKSPTFVKLHRNFRSVTVNLQTASGTELARQLVGISDVLVENFSLGVLPKLGLGYEDVRKLRPDIIMISLRGFGSTGPWASYATWGPNLGAVLGLTHLWNYPEAETPTAEARSQHPDFMSGVCGAFAVMSALIHRRKTGSGQWIDAAQVEAGAFTMGPLFLDALLNDRDARPLGNRSPWVAPQGVYRCAGEDQWCAISVETDEQWRGLRLALGNPEWARSPGLQTLAGRLVCHDEIDRHIEEWTRLRDKYDVMEVLQRHGIPTGAVQGVEDQICKDPQYKARGFFASIQEPEMGELLSENLPVQLLETPGCYQTPAPLMGQHTDEICVTLLGMNQRRILELQSEKVLY